MGIRVRQVKPSNCFRLHPTSVRQRFPNTQHSRFLTARRRLEELVLSSILTHVFHPCRVIHQEFLISSSSSSARISEHSRLHKLTPLWTIMRTHPRCVETNVVGPKVELLYCTEPCPRLGRPARRRQSAGERLMAARRMREWSCDGSALARCPNILSLR